jgi:ATP-binding cassette subfamily B protein
MPELTWPSERLYELLHHLSGRPGELPTLSARFPESLPLACRQLGLEAHPAEVPLDALWRTAPSLLCVGPDLVAIVRGGPRELTVIARDGQAIRVDPAILLPTPTETQSPALPAVPARLLALASAPSTAGTVCVYALRAPRSPPLGAAALQLGALHVLRLGLLALGWWILGRGAAQGSLDTALLLGWSLGMASLVLVTAGADWLQGHVLLDLHLWYRRRTMQGATKVTPALSRSLGSGQLLGRAFEAEALDTLAVTAAISGVTALVDVLFCLALFLSVSDALAIAFVAWLLLVAAFGAGLYRLQRDWTLQRIAMSEDIVEGLLGRRTRLAQLGARRAHEVEDQALQRYVRASASVDGAETTFEAAAGRGWLLLGLLVLAAQVLPFELAAAALGGVLLGFQALSRAAGSVHLAAALVISWRQARVLYRASSLPELPGVPALIEAERRRPPRQGALVQASRMACHPVLEEASLSLGVGERVLLTGPSGGGKSTLARLLCGLVEPTSGTLSLRGFDRQALGEHEWARRIAYVPPFCDNHVFSASFLYNLLPGRWPAGPGALLEAERVCDELGLRPLLERMPGGLQQIVGETGWRLSHGERSRLFLARALLQGADLVILDESFGALDADTLKRCMECALQRSTTLVLISHA